MSDYASYGLDTVKKTHDEGHVGSSYCPWCLNANVSKGFSMCFSNWCICPSCVWLAHTDSMRKNKDFWNEDYECYKCGKKNVLCFISPTKGITLGICVDCIQWAHDVLSKQSNQQKKSMPTLEESLLKCKVEGCIVYLPPISEGPLENYLEVRKALLNAGAKYKRNTFVFPNEAQLYIDRLVSGESVNIKKEFQFFATPKDIAEMMVSYLPPVADDAKVLEPSAGDGALIKAFHAAYPNITVHYFELMDINRDRLKALPGTLQLSPDDFLQAVADDERRLKELGNGSVALLSSFDIIIANPPFTKNQDIDHINAMYKCLAPGGTLITLASPSWTFGTQKKQVEFKQWLEDLDVFPKTLPEKSFASSGTNITPVLLQIQKPVEASGFEPISDPITVVGTPELSNETSEHRKPQEILQDLKAINKEVEKGIDQLEQMLNNDEPVKKCRVCGCTDDDCRQCIEKTGEPCHWVEDDLCSACDRSAKENIGDDDDEDDLIDEEIANEHEGFKFNVAGNCLNPESVVRYGTEKQFAYEVHVCNTPKGWAFGYSMNCNSSLNGSGLAASGASLHSKTFPDRVTAALAGCKEVLTMFEDYMDDVPQLKAKEGDLKSLKAMIDHLTPEETAAVPDAYQEYLSKRNSSSITFTEMKFFEQLKHTGKDVHLSIDIKEKNGKYTVMVLPKASDASRIMPIVVTGTADELDEGFFKKVGPQLIETGLQLQGVAEHRKSVEEATKSNDKKSTPAATSSTEKKPEKKGPAAAAAKKNADKKAGKKDTPKKSAAKKEEPKTEETPKVVEQALF